MKATVQIRGIDETQDRGARLMAARAELEATAIEYGLKPPPPPDPKARFKETGNSL